MRYVILLLVALSSGCASVSVKDPSGFEFKRKSYWWSDTKISGAKMTTDANGVRVIELIGYEQSSKDTMAGVIAASVEGAIKGVKTSQGLQ